MKIIIVNRKVFWFYFSAIIFMAVLPINSAGELNNITILRFRGDYFLHALMFIPWMLFYQVLKAKWWLWLFCGFLFASGSEAIQYYLPYRAFNINDLIANIIGIIVGGIFVGHNKMKL